MSGNTELIAKARAYVQPSLDRDLWNPGLQAVLDLCTILEAIEAPREYPSFDEVRSSGWSGASIV